MSRGRSGCPSCHAGVSDDAAFCPTCGNALGPVLVTDADDPVATAAPEVVFGRRSTRRQWWPWAALVAGVLLTRAITSAGHEGGDAPTIGNAAATSTSTTEPSTTIFTDPTTTTSLPQRLTSGNGPLLGERTGLELWINAFFQGANPSPTGVYRIDLDSGSIDLVAQGLTFDRGPDRSAVVTRLRGRTTFHIY